MAEELQQQPRKKRALRRVSLHVLLSVLAVLTALLLYFILNSLSLRLVNVSIESKVVSPIRIVHLSDLHNAQFGRQNAKLVESVAAQSPDLIFMSGDMLNSSEENTDTVTSLIADLQPIAPVYYGYGNHEKAWEKRFGRDLKPIMEAAGAVVVDVDFVDLEVRGTRIRIGGYMAYYGVPHMTAKEKKQQDLEFAFFEDFQSTDRLKLLIDHIPTGWVDWNYVDKYPVDLVFSGHYHGGTMRVPILDRGLYAPYVGWFPPFSKGVYSGTLAACILSPGLGSEYHIPRVNNPPVILVVDLIPNNAE